MAKVVILGAGISGHTAAAYLRKWLNKQHEIVVVTPNRFVVLNLKIIRIVVGGHS